MKPDSTDSWDRYWAHGFLTSCADAFSGNYEGSMRRLWEQRFAALPDGSRVLDICTGNGAIALIAAATAREQERGFSIDAIDLAEIHPDRAVAPEQRVLLDLIQFHSRTDVCATGFENDSFDLVTGHFALEYADRQRAVAELVRITGRDGENMFVMHSTESVILQTAAEELRHIALLEEAGLFHKAREMITLVGNTPADQRAALAGSEAAETARNALNDAAAAITAGIERAQHPELLRTALGHVSEAYQAIGSGVTGALERLARGEREIAANAGRLHDLTSAASTRQQMGELGEVYARHGFDDYTLDTISEDPAGLLGWVVRVRRSN